MQTLKKYTKEAFMAITSLGTVFFYTIIFLFLFFIKEFTIAKHIAIGLILCYLFVFVLRIFYFKERPEKEEYYNLFSNCSGKPHKKINNFNFFSFNFFVNSVFQDILKKALFCRYYAWFNTWIIASIIYLLII